MMSGSIKKYSKKVSFTDQYMCQIILHKTHDFGSILYIKMKKLKFQFILSSIKIYQILQK